MNNGKVKKGLVSKTWEHCKSFRGVGDSMSSHDVGEGSIRRTRSLPPLDEITRKPRNTAPKGYFSVYVGAEKKRFVIKAEHANHSHFKAFLAEAEAEYGFTKEASLELPCEINDFEKVLLEIGNCYGIPDHQ